MAGVGSTPEEATPRRAVGDPSSEVCSTSEATGVGEPVAWRATSESKGADKAEGGIGEAVPSLVVVMGIEVGIPAAAGSEGAARPSKAEAPGDVRGSS